LWVEKKLFTKIEKRKRIIVSTYIYIYVYIKVYMTSDAQAITYHPPANAQLAPEQWKKER